MGGGATTYHREVSTEDRGREFSEVVSGTKPDIFQESPLLSPKMFFLSILPGLYRLWDLEKFQDLPFYIGFETWKNFEPFLPL